MQYERKREKLEKAGVICVNTDKELYPYDEYRNTETKSRNLFVLLTQPPFTKNNAER